MPLQIALGGDLFATVDEGDYQAVASHKWHPLRSGQRIYARSSIKLGGRFRTVLMHRLLLDPAPRALVDHKDGDGLNNTRKNLRICTPRQNSANCAARGSSGFIGVRRGSTGWIASVAPEGVEIHLGTYATPTEAARAYDAAAARVYGEFARLNSTPIDGDLAPVLCDKQAAIARLQREIQILGGA